MGAAETISAPESRPTPASPCVTSVNLGAARKGTSLRHDSIRLALAAHFSSPPPESACNGRRDRGRPPRRSRLVGRRCFVLFFVHCSFSTVDFQRRRPRRGATAAAGSGVALRIGGLWSSPAAGVHCSPAAGADLGRVNPSPSGRWPSPRPLLRIRLGLPSRGRRLAAGLLSAESAPNKHVARPGFGVARPQ